ncbi:MAG: hypothetical protein J7L64_04965 [Acidobacteria bacterium]|nr:hypothetical protein [Acidobacteriota bacterium]
MEEKKLTPGELAFKEGEEALKKKELTSAERAYNRALVHFTKERDLLGIGGTLYNLGRIHHLRKEYRKALSSYILARNIFYQIDPLVADRVEKDINKIKTSLGEEKYEELLKEIEKGLKKKIN